MSNKAVVTGVAGFIGSHLAEHLLEQGYSVIGIDNFHSYYSEEVKRDNLAQIRSKAEDLDEEFSFLEGSILEKSDLEKLPDNPELVFHLAAVAGTRSSMDNPSEYIKVNVHGTSKLIESFESIGKFVFTSSSSVYGEVSPNELPVDENSNLSPETPYALSKMNAEELVRLYADMYGFDYAILRPFTVYGPRMRPNKMVTISITMNSSRKP
jgi:nucleoside-diphosphate-sugar epimerase